MKWRRWGCYHLVASGRTISVTVWQESRWRRGDVEATTTPRRRVGKSTCSDNSPGAFRARRVCRAVRQNNSFNHLGFRLHCFVLDSRHIRMPSYSVAGIDSLLSRCGCTELLSTKKAFFRCNVPLGNGSV